MNDDTPPSGTGSSQQAPEDPPIAQQPSGGPQGAGAGRDEKESVGAPTPPRLEGQSSAQQPHQAECAHCRAQREQQPANAPPSRAPWIAAIAGSVAAIFSGWNVYVGSEQMSQSLRAWVTLDTIDANQTTLRVVIKNSGRTPALYTANGVILRYVPAGTAASADFTKWKALSVSVVGPGADAHSTLEKGASDYDGPPAPGMDLIAFGLIEYTDIFGTRHCTRFCQRYLERGRFVWCATGNDIRCDRK